MRLYKIKLDYIKHLYNNYDKRVQYNEHKSESYNGNRPYIGVLLEVNNVSYFAPLEHPRPSHKTLKNNPHIIKIKEGKYGLIGLNNMIPVCPSQLISFNINNDPNKNILQTQFIFCQNNRKHITDKANKIYTKRTTRPNKFEEKIYCDFKKLENGMYDYLKLKGISHEQVNKFQKQQSIPEKLEAAKQKSKEQSRQTTIDTQKDISDNGLGK